MTQGLWIVPAYPWAANPVAGIFFRTQAHAIARRGLDVVVACPTPWAPWPLSRIRPKWRRYAGAPSTAMDEIVSVVRPRYVNVPGQPAWALPDRVIARAVWRARSAWQGAEVIHGHSAVTGLAAWRLAQRTGLPFVLTFHGGDLNSWPDAHRDRLGDLRAAAREARAVIAVSEALAERARIVTGVHAIHQPLGSNVHELIAAVQPRREARAALQLPADATIILFVGNLLQAKGVRELVEAILGGGDDYLGVFVGEGPESGRGRDQPGGDRLDYRGAIPHREIVRYMSAADVLVLPSRTEGLPSVLVEAGAVGLPVIASSVGGIPALLGGNRGALLPDTSPSAIRRAIDELVSHPAETAAAAARLQEFVRTHHDVDVNAARLMELYRL